MGSTEVSQSNEVKNNRQPCCEAQVNSNHLPCNKNNNNNKNNKNNILHDCDFVTVNQSDLHHTPVQQQQQQQQQHQQKLQQSNLLWFCPRQPKWYPFSNFLPWNNTNESSNKNKNYNNLPCCDFVPVSPGELQPSPVNVRLQAERIILLRSKKKKKNI